MKIPKFIKYPKDRLIVVLTLIILILVLFVFVWDYTVAKHGLTSGLNLDKWDWFALIVATFTLAITILTWLAQDQTRENTTRLDTNDYRDILVSSYYNIVRNTINLYSLSAYMADKFPKYYPSEEYLQKLKIYLFDADQIPSQNVPKKYRGQFQRIAELSRYFNLHIDSAQKHLMAAALPSDIKTRDLETLKAMHWLLAKEIMKVINYICPDNDDENRKLVRDKIAEVVKNFRPETVIPASPHGHVTDVKFLTRLYAGSNAYSKITDSLNISIDNKLHNDSIPLVPFV